MEVEVEAAAYWIDRVARGLADTAAELRELGAAREACPTLRSLARLDHEEGGAVSLLERIAALGARAEQRADGMRFRMLYDEDRKLFSIGYDVVAGRLDASYYDLLASEARLASLVAIAKGEVPQEHWFRLGRQLTAAADHRALLSWSGSMFEYLMPLLVTRTYERTLLDETYVAVVRRQREYGGQRGVPWGVSESAYNTHDLGLTYQYHAFGVPAWGSSPASPTSWWSRPTPARSRRWCTPTTPARTCAPSPRRASTAPTASTTPSTTRPPTCRRAGTAWWSRPSWPTTRA